MNTERITVDDEGDVRPVYEGPINGPKTPDGRPMDEAERQRVEARNEMWTFQTGEPMPEGDDESSEVVASSSPIVPVEIDELAISAAKRTLEREDPQASLGGGVPNGRALTDEYRKAVGDHIAVGRADTAKSEAPKPKNTTARHQTKAQRNAADAVRKQRAQLGRVD